MFWLHDAYHDGQGTLSWKRRWPGTLMAVATVIAGLFVCVAGLYVNIRGIVIAYVSGPATQHINRKNKLANFHFPHQGHWRDHRAFQLLAATVFSHIVLRIKHVRSRLLQSRFAAKSLQCSKSSAILICPPDLPIMVCHRLHQV